MVGAIAPGTMDVGSNIFFLSVFPREKTPRIHTVSARAAAGAADPPAGILLRWPPHPPSVAVAGGSGDAAGVVGFLGTNGTGP